MGPHGLPADLTLTAAPATVSLATPRLLPVCTALALACGPEDFVTRDGGGCAPDFDACQEPI